MLRLSEANSILKAREAEVASLQAQNALLRQQVEQQQQQLDAGVHIGVQEECEDGDGGVWWAGEMPLIAEEEPECDGDIAGGECASEPHL
jgi:hypothetical protein